MKIKQWLVKRSRVCRDLQRLLYRFKPYEAKFRTFYLESGWGGDRESRSGPGSSLRATRLVRGHLVAVLMEYPIRHLLDIPCGDFHWMKEVDLSGIDYLGIDIVPELIRDNRAKYARRSIRFELGDLLKDALPSSDLVLCRDCLIHFPNKVALAALANIRRSGGSYLLTTTYAGLVANLDIPTIGCFRPVNLQLPPFSLPRPVAVFREARSDELAKSLALWRLADIPH